MITTKWDGTGRLLYLYTVPPAGVLCNSILQNHSVMSPDKTIKFSPEKSILKLQVGDEIKLTESDFVLLYRAFFDEIETTFV
jgi:hypothetical protein